VNHVEFIRDRLTIALMRQVALLRITVSGTEGNTIAVDRLRGEHGDRLVAKLTSLTLIHMGHDPDGKNFKGEQQSPDDANSNNMRAIKRSRSRGQERDAELEEEAKA
jgi:hypothetical protein